MSIISDVPEIHDSVALMSVEFYHASSEMGWIDEDTELLRGIPVKKMSKSPEHEYFVRLFLRLIEAALPNGCFLAKESPLTTSDSEPEPDLMVVEGQEKDFRSKHPSTARFIVEVAINTEKRDLSKADIYSEAGVEEYWLVLPEKKQINVFRSPDGKNGYQDIKHHKKGSLSAEALAGIEIQLPRFFE